MQSFKDLLQGTIGVGQKEIDAAKKELADPNTSPTKRQFLELWLKDAERNLGVLKKFSSSAEDI